VLFNIYPKCQDVDSCRESLIEDLEILFFNLKIHATVVFDNRYYLAGSTPSRYKKYHLEVIYTPSRLTADEFILEMILSSTASKHTVISSDRDLIKKAKELGTKTKNLDEFFKEIARKKRKLNKPKEKKVHKSSKHELDSLHDIFEKRLNELSNE
jgi:predicted RNA-binding protein with PIN domain